MRAWFYKDGVGKIFEDGICPEGWTDHPNGWSAEIIAAQEKADAEANAPVEEKPAPKKKASKKKAKKAE